MKNVMLREVQRVNRHKRLRKNVKGTTERPRLCVHRSLKNLNAQIVDDTSGKIIFGMNTLSKDFQSKVKYGGNVKAATVFGQTFASAAKEKGIKKVCFDRGGYKYHGRVKAFADAAREAGLEF